MEALVVWFEKRKRYIPLFIAIVILGILFLPRGFKEIGIVFGGLAWHLGNAETASAFWLGLGFSPASSQMFAISGGELISLGFCVIGFSLKSLRLPKAHEWLASHPRVAKLPYPGIIILGLLLPVGGVVAGIFIARNAALKKIPATLTILGVNLIKLLGWGEAITHLLGPLLR